MVYVMEFKYTDCPQDAAPEKKRELFRKQGEAGGRFLRFLEGSRRTVPLLPIGVILR